MKEQTEHVVISSEFRLAVECCRSCFQLGDSTRLAEICATVDWPRFVRLARFHRIQGLAWHGLGGDSSNVPLQVARELSADAAAIAAANLRGAVECRDLLLIFDDAGIPLLFVKGLTLGALAYSNIAWKSAVDIDLLIALENLADTARLLHSNGYRLSEPKLHAQTEVEQLQAWHRARKESTWINPQRKFQIDLHTRLSDNPRLVPSIGVHSTHCRVEVAPGISLPTLGSEDLFAYLGVHGASSAWFRLKWITDFAALLGKSEPAEIERLYWRSQELGASRAAAQALLLADALYGTLNDLPELRRKFERDSAIRWLYHAALKQLAGRAEPIEPTAERFGTWRIHLSQLPLMPGWSFTASELSRQVHAALC